MTDLLGLLSEIHRALAHLGTLQLAITDLDGYAGVVNHRTRTIHLAPGLSLPETLRVLADALATLAPAAAPTIRTIAAGGEADLAAGVVPVRHLSAVPSE